MNCSTSILGGFVIFSIIGYRKTLTDQAFSQLKSGPGLAFVAIAEAVANMHISPLWAILFYSMLLLLGVDSLFGMLESMLHQLREEIPILRQVKKHGLSAAVCAAMFLMALPTTMNGGLYVIELMDNWAVTMPLLVAALGEIISVMWIYGIHRFVREIKEKTGVTIGWYWQICWMVVSPLILIVILVASLVNAFTSLSYEKFVGCIGDNSTFLEDGYTLMSNASLNSAWIKTTPLPPAGIFIALSLLFLPILMIPTGAVVAYFTKDEASVRSLKEEQPATSLCPV